MWFWRMVLDPKNWNEGTKNGTTAPKTGTRDGTKKPACTFAKTALNYKNRIRVELSDPLFRESRNRNRVFGKPELPLFLNDRETRTRVQKSERGYKKPKPPLYKTALLSFSILERNRGNVPLRWKTAGHINEGKRAN